jgi:hypothetical protein
LLSIAASAGGCGTTPSGKRWADDAALLPGWKRVGAAAWNALASPWTWAPLAGAAVMQIDDWDERVSDWAIDHTPVFGSVEDAKDARGWTGNVSDAAYYASALATPSGDDALGWTLDKVKGLAVGGVARYGTLFVTDVLKESTGRTRPDHSDDTSFPSQHSAGLAVNATLTCSNIGATRLPDPAKVALDVGVIGFSAYGSWSRIEAGGHFPSDVLVGAALGHFLGRFFDEAFLRLPEGFTVEPLVSRNDVGVALSFRF